ncbi:MAG: hypothetical protein C5B50_13900 [Verrucomicrobia bacterium]|nr:MAG: hypothetical protein C5B50_13900 [Verrucomicrobiota bacterium]
MVMRKARYRNDPAAPPGTAAGMTEPRQERGIYAASTSDCSSVLVLKWIRTLICAVKRHKCRAPFPSRCGPGCSTRNPTESSRLSFPYAAVAVLLLSLPAAFSQEFFSTSSNAPPSIPERLQKLEQGQQQILKELETIKGLLREHQNSNAIRPAAPKVFSIDVTGEPFRGSAQAQTAIMEYSDFECSYCAHYARDVYPALERDFIKTGKLKYFFRDMPAREHLHALQAAEAARCAGEEGKFWEMHDVLFAAQPALAETNLLSYAQLLGIDGEKFRECLLSGRHTNSIHLSIQTAKRLGIYGTPAFVLGRMSPDGNFLLGEKVLVGGESDKDLRPAIEQLLSSQSGTPK